MILSLPSSLRLVSARSQSKRRLVLPKFSTPRTSAAFSKRRQAQIRVSLNLPLLPKALSSPPRLRQLSLVEAQLVPKSHRKLLCLPFWTILARLALARVPQSQLTQTVRSCTRVWHFPSQGHPPLTISPRWLASAQWPAWSPPASSCHRRPRAVQVSSSPISCQSWELTWPAFFVAFQRMP